MLFIEQGKTIYKCNLCEQEYTYKHWWDKKTKGLEIIRMQLGLCSTCYYTFKGERVSNKEDKSDYVDLEVTREEKCILLDLLRQEMRSWNEDIIKEWSESYHVIMCPGDSRVQRFKPDDEVYAQHQLLKLTKLFRKVRDSGR